MMRIKPLLGSIAVLVLLGCYPQSATAEGFTGEQFLKWPDESKHSMIDTSVIMTAIIATRNRQDISRCIDDWYSGDKAIQRKQRNKIIKTIRENPSYHPQGVVLAVLEKQCGSFKAPSD